MFALCASLVTKFSLLLNVFVHDKNNCFIFLKQSFRITLFLLMLKFSTFSLSFKMIYLWIFLYM